MADEPKLGADSLTGRSPQSKNELTASLTQAFLDAELLLERARAIGREDMMQEIESLRSSLMTTITKLDDFDLGETLWLTASNIKKTALSTPPEVAAKPASAAALRKSKGASILIIDDDIEDLETLGEFLALEGYAVSQARDGEYGLFIAQSKSPDLIILDFRLPGMSGLQVLEHLRSDIAIRNVPVIMLSGMLQSDDVVKCIELGAEDFLYKPVNPILLRARIEAGLDRKRLHDLEQSYLSQLQIEQEKSERLLLNILPGPIADRLKAGEGTIADSFPDVTVLFADVVEFTSFSTKVPHTELIYYLNQIFSAYDRLAVAHGLEKIKTIGDAYMVVGGLPTQRDDHADAIAAMALDMLGEIQKFNARNKLDLCIRIGINTGPVIAGVIGEKKFIYDLWGDTVNTASRMESHGQPGAIHVAESTYQKLKSKFRWEERGSIEIKGKGMMLTYFLSGKLS